MIVKAFQARGTELMPLSKETLHEKVFGQLTKLILDGGIAPGEVVTVQSLATAFGVSPMPVREALGRLVAANALTVVSGRSIGLAALSRARLTDLRNVRMEIEAIAAGWAAERRTDAELAQVKRHLQTLERIVNTGNAKGYVSANYAFHFSIYRAAKSENTLRIVENLWLQISPYFNTLREFYSTSNVHHRDMFAALVDKDSTAIAVAVRADIDSAYRELAFRLKD